MEAAELREQIAQQIMPHGIAWIERQRLSEYLFGFLIAIFSQERSRLAKAAKLVLPRSLRRAKTADRLITMHQL